MDDCASDGARDSKVGDAPSWSAGVVNHGAYDDLERCLSSLRKQRRSPRRVVVWDTGVDPARSAALAGAFPEVEFSGGENQGYAGGANRVVAALRDDADFVLVLNPDIDLDPTFAERLVDALTDEPRAAVATGKLLRPDRRTIDSAGIEFPRHRRPRDRGSEAPDDGRFDRREAVGAASGAAILLRVAALEALSIEGELFDERFFAYHEDTDLGWRARRLGWTVLYEPTAVAIHGRRWRKAERTSIPIEVRRHSFKNHYLQLVKNETLAGVVANAPWLVCWEVLRLGFVLLREPSLLPAYGTAMREMPTAWRRRRLIRERAAELEVRRRAQSSR